VAVAQYTFTHKQYTEHTMKENTHNRTYITNRIHNITIRIHNIHNETEEYKTYNRIYNDTK
jgi:hypothetical protein